MNYTYIFDEKESQIILNALVKQPYIEVVEIINKLQEQAKKQLDEKNERTK